MLYDCVVIWHEISNYIVWHDWAIALRTFLSNVFSSIDTKFRNKLLNFAVEPLLLIIDVAKILLHFLLCKVCNTLKLNLFRVLFFSLEKGFLFKLILLVCCFYTSHFSFASEARTRQIVLSFEVQFIYSFSQQIQLTKLLHIYILLHYYISNQLDHRL